MSASEGEEAAIEEPAEVFAPRPRQRVVKQGRRGQNSIGLPPERRDFPDIAVSLIRSALDLFASRNYSSVTIKDIAGAVGVNPSLIYYYFGNKDDLFLEVINYVVEEAFAKYHQSVRNEVEPVKIISQWIETHIIQFVLMQKLARISLDYVGTRAQSETAERAIRKFYDQEAIVLSRAIRAGIAKGQFRQVEPQDTAIFISTFLDGSLFRHMMFKTFDYAAAIDNMRRILLAHLSSDVAQGRQIAGTEGAPMPPATGGGRRRHETGLQDKR